MGSLPWASDARPAGSAQAAHATQSGPAERGRAVLLGPARLRKVDDFSLRGGVGRALPAHPVDDWHEFVALGGRNRRVHLEDPDAGFRRRDVQARIADARQERKAERAEKPLERAVHRRRAADTVRHYREAY